LLNYQIVIPARGGSKRFPKKNIANFLGKPLISHTIEYALKTFSKDYIWVNTDDSEISDVARQYDINITHRPEHLGTDIASTVDVLIYQYNHFMQTSVKCDAIILLQVTNPLRPDNMIEDAISLFERNNRGSLASFSKLNKKHGKIESSFFIPKNYLPGQRMQDIEPEYFENGLIYITKASELLNGKVISNDVFPFVFDGIEAKVDIDEPDDLMFAEFISKNITKI
jgi:N-acylneuraminate cytidylyltransferase